MVNGITIQSRRKLSGFDLKTKKKLYKYSLNKFHSTGGLRNSVSLGSNTTRLASPGVNINISISKVDRIKSNSNKTYINYNRNNNIFNNNIMINYLKNNKIININKSNNNHSIKNESNFFHFNNEYQKDLIKRRNKVNIFEEHSKLLINSRKLLNLKKNKEDISNQNTFDKDTKIEKTTSFNCNNINLKNSRSHNKQKDLLNKIRINSLNENVNTITHENLFKNKEKKNKTLINFNYKNNKNKEKEKDTKFIRCKKEILENMTKSLGIEQILKKKENENKIIIKSNIKAKWHLETENIVEKNNEKEKNKTEMNKAKDIDNQKNENNKKTQDIYQKETKIKIKKKSNKKCLEKKIVEENKEILIKNKKNDINQSERIEKKRNY